jgi:hypothetical protein
MENITANSFMAHIKSKEGMSKEERAKFLYSSYTFDCALPQEWVNFWSQKLQTPQSEIVSNFVWLYFKKYTFDGQPAPLTIRGCEILQAIETVTAYEQNN